MVTRSVLPALGIRLTFTSSSAGGRTSTLAGGSEPDARLNYRPNWGLPGWEDLRQSGAPVLGFGSTHIEPGETTTAVIVAIFVEAEPEWRQIVQGDELRMYEGAQVCGTATVLWVDSTTSIRDLSEQDRLLHRLAH